MHVRARPGADAVAEPAGGRVVRVPRPHGTSCRSTSRRPATRFTALVRWASWTVAERETSRVVVRHELHPRPGYPFSLELSIEYSLSPAGLRVQTTATNVGAEPCPFGSGAHPYLTIGTETIDSADPPRPGPNGAVLGRSRHPHRPGRRAADRARLPAAEADRRDAARPRVHGPRAGRGRCGPRRAAPAGRAAGLVLWVDESYRWLMLFTGRPAARRRSPQPRRRADDLPAERLSLGEDLIVLEPGGSFAGAWGLGPL